MLLFLLLRRGHGRHRLEAALGHDGELHKGLDAFDRVGGLNALTNPHRIYMLGSKMASVSVTYRW